LCSELIAFTADESQPDWRGYMFACLFLAEFIVYSILYNQVYHISMTTALQTKAALIAVVYKKVRFCGTGHWSEGSPVLRVSGPKG